jgi:hypothetical protein
MNAVEEVEKLTFADLPDNAWFRVDDDKCRHKLLHKHILPPFGNECATNDRIQIVLLRDDTPVVMEPALSRLKGEA